MNAQDLKNSILQLAIQGKLVEQREEEGSAQKLLKQIEEEKKKLVKEKEIKRQKSLPEISEEEIPFDIPENWQWTRLETVTYIIGNKSNQIKQTEILQEGKYPVVSQSINRIEGYSNEISKILRVEPLSVIVFGDHSKTLKLIDFDFIIGADGTKIIVPISLNPEYFYHVLNYNVINMRDRGYSRHFQFLKEKLIPIPPLEEQNRIVAKILELMPYVDKYDVAYSEVVELNKKFPEDMQKSILQYAIQGKLVEQREEDGTAEDLYKQIQEEKKKLIKEGKIKKTKALPAITEDEIPFDIPENWKWVRLGDVLTKITDGTHHSPANYETGSFMYVTAKNIKENGIDLTNITYVTEEVHKKIYDRCNPEYGDILLIKDGATTGIATVNNVHEPFSLLSSVALLKAPSLIYTPYIVYVLRSDLFYRNIRKQMKGTGITRVTLKQIMPLIIPLPPLAGQKRIVEKIEELLPYAKQLVK